MIVTGEVGDDGVYETEQEPDERLHVVELNCVVLPTEVENPTVPVGLSPETVAVQLVGEPAVTGDGEQETEVDVATATR